MMTFDWECGAVLVHGCCCLKFWLLWIFLQFLIFFFLDSWTDRRGRLGNNNSLLKDDGDAGLASDIQRWVSSVGVSPIAHGPSFSTDAGREDSGSLRSCSAEGDSSSVAWVFPYLGKEISNGVTNGKHDFRLKFSLCWLFAPKFDALFRFKLSSKQSNVIGLVIQNLLRLSLTNIQNVESLKLSEKHFCEMELFI